MSSTHRTAFERPASLPSSVAKELRRLIADELAPGAQLPSEKELAARLGVSRATLRDALLQLWNEGLVIRRWGVGTFVRDTEGPVAMSLSQVIPVRDTIRAAGHEPQLVHVDIQQVPCDAEVAEALTAPREDLVWQVDRVFTVDDAPAVFLRDWLPTRINGRSVDPAPLKDMNVDLGTLLRDTATCRIIRMEAALEAVAAEGDAMQLLHVSQGTPLMRARQASYADDGQVVTYNHLYVLTAVMGLQLVRTVRP